MVGRAGRGAAGGKALIQTMTPQSPVIRMAAQQDYDAFYRGEIEVRRAMLYPPFADLCVVGFVGTAELLVREAANSFLSEFKSLAAEAPVFVRCWRGCWFCTGKIRISMGLRHMLI